jgi:hypothetical protein
MHVQSPTLKAYEDKASAQLQELKARIDLFQAQANNKKADAEIAAIRHLKATKEAVDKKLQDLKTAGEATLARLKADVENDMANLRRSVDELASRFKA